MHGVGQNLLKLLREDSRLKTVTVEFVVVGECGVILIAYDSYLIDVVKLVFCSQLTNVVFDALVTRLDDVSGHFHISIHHKTLVRHVGVDANFPLMENRVLCAAALPTAQINVALELSRVRSSHDDPLARVTDDWVISSVGVSVKTDDQLKVSLFGVRSAFLPHVVAGCFRKVKAADCDLSDLTVLQIDSEKILKLFKPLGTIDELTELDKKASWIGLIVIAQCELSVRVFPT